MKNEQKEEAKKLFFESTLNKSQIADKVGVARKTLLFWSQQGNWDKLKMSAMHTPAIVAEKCYYLIDQFTSSLLIDGVGISSLTLQHAQTLHLLASTIKKIKTRSTVGESMEMFNFFLSGLNRRNPEMADMIKPQIEDFITIRTNNDISDFLMEGFNQDSTLPYPEEKIQEQYQDNIDREALNRDFAIFLESRKPQPSSGSAESKDADHNTGNNDAHSRESPTSVPVAPSSGPITSMAQNSIDTHASDVTSNDTTQPLLTLSDHHINIIDHDEVSPQLQIPNSINDTGNAAA